MPVTDKISREGRRSTYAITRRPRPGAVTDPHAPICIRILMFGSTVMHEYIALGRSGGFKVIASRMQIRTPDGARRMAVEGNAEH